LFFFNSDFISILLLYNNMPPPRGVGHLFNWFTLIL
jgi:hypothetical protein